MKKIILLFILTGTVVSAFAQAEFNLFAGPQVTTSQYSVRSSKQTSTPKYGFQAGVGCKIPFDVNLFFSPAAFYSMKGYKVKFTDRAAPPDTTATDNNTTIHTFELAFLLQYDFSGKPNHCFLKLGPSLDFQLFGKEKFDRSNASAISRDMTFDFANYNRYAVNMLLQFGYESASGIFVFAQYTHGLGSINNADAGPTIRHRVYGLSFGKFINRKSH